MIVVEYSYQEKRISYQREMQRLLTFCPLFGWKGAGENAILVLVAWRRSGGGGAAVLGGEGEAAAVF